MHKIHSKIIIQITTAEEALKLVKSGDNIFVHSVAATPHHLTDILVKGASITQNILFLNAIGKTFSKACFIK